MDAVEAQFAIKIELEEFMDVRTIRDISNRIAAIVEKKSARKAPTTRPRLRPVQRRSARPCCRC